MSSLRAANIIKGSSEAWIILTKRKRRKPTLLFSCFLWRRLAVLIIGSGSHWGAGVNWPLRRSSQKWLQMPAALSTGIRPAVAQATRQSCSTPGKTVKLPEAQAGIFPQHDSCLGWMSHLSTGLGDPGFHGLENTSYLGPALLTVCT